MSDPMNLPSLVLRSLRKESERPRLLWRVAGGVRKLTAPEIFARIQAIHQALSKLELQPGDRVGILAPSSAPWILFDLACLGSRLVTVPLFANVSKENLAWQIHDSGMKLVLVADAEQASLALECSRDVHVWDLSALEMLPEAKSSKYEEGLSAIQPGDIATIIYTSGSTGRPKGVLLSHQALLFQVQAAQDRFPTDPTRDLALSCLPLAHIFERIVTYFHIANGYPLAINSDVQKVGEDLKFFQPSILTVVPRLLEKMHAKMAAQVQMSRGPKGWLGRLGLDVASNPAHGAAKFSRILDLLVWRKVRAALGGRLRLVVSGGASLPDWIETSFHRMGIPVYNGYGMTENGPVISANAPGRFKPGTVGPLFRGVEAKFGDDGEILVRSKSTMSGYWNMPEDTARTFDPEGWLRTGDLGRMDEDGYLRLVGRSKDLCKTQGGKYVALGALEEVLARSPIVDHVVVCADGRRFVSAIFSLQTETVDASVLATIDDHVSNVNSRLNDWEKVRKWIVAPSRFSIETGEITPTMKVRRQIVLDKFQAELAKLYA